MASNDSESPIKDRELLLEFDELFDLIHAPNYHPKFYMKLLMTRFEMGVLRYKYFVSKDGTIDWAKAVKQVAR